MGGRGGKRVLSDGEWVAWLGARKQCEDKEKEYSNMLRQKSRFRWDVEGDKNSKFFHLHVRRRNNECNLRGLVVNGLWCEDSKIIKAGMARHYKNLFSEGGKTRLVFCSNKLEEISIEEARMLEIEFSEKEVWEAICSCGGDKAPGPDGKMMVSMGCNASFVTIIPKVPDPIGSSSMSNLVNGSSPKEFGLDIFRGVVVGASNVTVSRLKVNYNKSKIYGIGVAEGDLVDMAIWMGCGIGEFPFTYLGLPIGENMRRVKAWGPVVKKFKNRLTDWKAKTMSFEGHLTLVKSVLGSLPLREGGSLWVKMIESIHGSSGGLGEVRALDGRGIGGGVWSDIVRIGEEIDGMGIEFSSSYVGELDDGRDIRFWLDKWVDNRRLYDRFHRLYHLDQRKEDIVLDKGSWVNDVWCCKWEWVRNIRGRVSRELYELVRVVQNVTIHFNYKDRWRWSLGEDGEFTVKELARLVEEKILHMDSGGHETLWNKLVPKKVNIFVWRALKGRLPVRVELDRRGIDLDSVLCPSCNDIVETCAHCLVTCDLAMNI
ncbi:reverse transcriptase domain, reverse transcriptase zinc-binding domain protein [Tanacetum coccineum]|uniref:Reverse transcriptase domain, reverse transcriptase zinc-binding domain protein n=1 Tax=Tanacetum coccineum TaxID=301880 RepID=A0ABQ5J9K6_9ASTR